MGTRSANKNRVFGYRNMSVVVVIGSTTIPVLRIERLIPILVLDDLRRDSGLEVRV